MNTYSENFIKFHKLKKIKYNSYSEFVELIKSKLIEYPKEEDREAIILLGYSGNGKTTWVSSFLKDNSDYHVLSMDSIVESYSDVEKIDFLEFVNRIGEILEELSKVENKIILDGFFLSLLTRCSITQTLHSYGYNISVVDLTDYIDYTLPNRVFDFASKRLGKTIDSSNYLEYMDDPIFIEISNEILYFNEYERKTSDFSRQKNTGSWLLDVDKVLPTNFEKNKRYKKIKF